MMNPTRTCQCMGYTGEGRILFILWIYFAIGVPIRLVDVDVSFYNMLTCVAEVTVIFQ